MMITEESHYFSGGSMSKNELFKAFVHFMGMLADKYEKGRYDGRNEYACQCSKICIDALTANDLYAKEHFDRLHNEILAKMR
jgi:hypothetical protein